MASCVTRKQLGIFVKRIHGLTNKKILLIRPGKCASFYWSSQPQRLLSCSRSYHAEDKPTVQSTPAQELPKEVKVIKNPSENEVFALPRETFIPITTKSLIRRLIQEKDLLTEEEKKTYDDFSLALDGAIVNKYHGILYELKSLFDPINPDKDTISTRQWNRKERMDNEFWLIQKLANVMAKANFHELPKQVVERALQEHNVGDGVMVSVNPDKYDVMRYWALGRETPTVEVPWYRALINRVMKQPGPKPVTYYKRVVVAVRLKKDQKLMLKAFKEVPINALEQLLPDGNVKMTKFDKYILSSSVGIAVTGVIAKIVTMLAHVTVDWTLVVTGITGLIGVRAWTVYKNRRNKYLVDLSRMLYFKNIANNRGLITLLVDRAEDESFKEALLTYTFLLASRAPSVKGKDSTDMLPAEIGGIPAEQLERNVSEWIHQKTGSLIEFDSEEAVSLLRGFGILSEINGNLHALPLRSAMAHLPQQPLSIIDRVVEADLEEGYDREGSAETDEQYKEEDKKSKMFGWK